MANKDIPQGFSVHNTQGGYCPGVSRPYYVPAAYATGLFVGDAVVKTGTSNTAAVSAGEIRYQIGTLPTVAAAAAADSAQITGIITSIEPADRDSKTYSPASTESVVFVNDDPNALFEVQVDGTLAVTNIGANANIILTNAGSTVTGLSGTELGLASAAVGAGSDVKQLKILRMVNREDNEMGANAKVVVKINQHTEANKTLAI